SNESFTVIIQMPTELNGWPRTSQKIITRSLNASWRRFLLLDPQISGLQAHTNVPG
ncbi:hypothetical protein ACTXT7_017177, partial [Hymenolepis weldensis]